MADFTDDKEKMNDFHLLNKEEFLNSYSYLTEEEYDLTLLKVKMKTLDYIIQEYNDDTNFPWRNSPVMSGEEKFDELLKIIRLELNELRFCNFKLKGKPISKNKNFKMKGE